jgi:hypothetical protein
MPRSESPPLAMNPVLARAAVGIVVALAVAGALNFYRTVDEKNLRYTSPSITDIIDVGPERFRGVIAMLPTEAVVGYISDLPNSSPESSQRAHLWFFGARYALAPRLLVRPTNAQKEDWVLGNFFKPMDLVQIERENHLNLVRDFGSGVLVFRKW